MSVIHLHKRLAGPPAVVGVPRIGVRTITVPDDVPAWLALRARATAGLTPQPRPWLHADYEIEMFNKSWWHAERNWLAVVDGVPKQAIGAVTLAVRTSKTARVPVVHWLLVDPQWRRRGVGRMLMSHLERAAWNAGFRGVELETHARWSAGVAFYQSIGYEPVRAPSPR